MLLLDDRASARHAAAFLVAAQAELNTLRAQEQGARDTVAPAATAPPAGAPAPAATVQYSIPHEHLLAHFEERLGATSIADDARQQVVEILRQSYAQEMCVRGRGGPPRPRCRP